MSDTRILVRMTDTGRSLAASQDHCHLRVGGFSAQGRRCSPGAICEGTVRQFATQSLAHPGTFRQAAARSRAGSWLPSTWTP